MNKGRTFAQLQESERAKIEVLLQQGMSYTKIAGQLGRSVSTISREIGRNESRRGKRPVYYSSRVAQSKAVRRHRLKAKRSCLDEQMKRRIVKWLTVERLSPKLISVCGRRERTDFISHEWIYRWIWSMKHSMARAHRPWRGLYKYLKHARRHRKRGNYRSSRGNILSRVWIDKRPASANERSRMGDLEADLVLGINRQPGLLVVLDRKSRKTWLRKLNTKTSRQVIDKVKHICLQAGNVRTVTFDNDQAFAEHYRLHEQSGINTFFTHPYSSQEKGSVENRIGLVRMFFNKKTDFTKVTSAQVKSVQNKLNNRPLRMFNYKTPNEIFNNCIY